MKKVLFFWVFLLCISSVPCRNSIFPLISELSSQDPVFCQYSDDVKQARKALAEGEQGNALPLHFYRYRAKKDDTIIRIAARCGILYDALITLNAIETVKTEITGNMLILPTLPALYVAKQPSSDIGRLTEALCEKMNIKPIAITLPLGKDHQKKKHSISVFPMRFWMEQSVISFLHPITGFLYRMQWLPPLSVCGKAPLPEKPRIMQGLI